MPDSASYVVQVADVDLNRPQRPAAHRMTALG